MPHNFSNLYKTSQSGGGVPQQNQLLNWGVGAAPFSGSLPTSQVEMTISCRNLINADYTSKSDPFCIVKMRESWQDTFFEIGRTEKINDNLNPEWVEKFIIDYSFETVQKLRFEVRDEDPHGNDFLGEFETTLADVVAFPGRQVIGRLKGPKRNCGEIVLVVEEVSSSKKTIDLQFAARNLEKLSWYCKNDPFLIFSRSNEDGTYSVVFKTEVGHSQNHRWRPINIHSRTLCNGDFKRSIKIDCYDNRANGRHKLIGTCYTTMHALSQGVCENNRFALKHKVRGRENCGTLILVFIAVTEEVSFLDYIRGGTQMHFAVAIDFTASNGPPQDPRSLHHFDDANPNQYEIALRSVGDIIQPYDSAQLFPAFGFGAKVPPNWDVSHQFPLNGNPSHPYCSGVTEIIEHYRANSISVEFYGPTNFAPVISNTIEIASQFQDGKHYFVLLIITDGIISDMHNTKQAIINASKLPISIIIVGVGNADFAAMDELDADDAKLRLNGLVAERDIVQFVPMNKFVGSNGSILRSHVDLAKEVLAEIPAQLTGYMKTKQLKPDRKKPRLADPITSEPTAPSL